MSSPAPLRPLDWRDDCAVALAGLLGLRWLCVPTQVARARQAEAAARQRRL